jgi:hypothetical protein
MSNSNVLGADSEIKEIELRLVKLREQKQREEEEQRHEEEECHKAEEARLQKEEAKRKKAEVKVRKAKEKKVRAEEAWKKKEREDEVKKAKAKDSEESGLEESGDDKGEAEEEVIGDKRKWSVTQDCKSCIKKNIKWVWPTSGSKKQKSSARCHGSKIVCKIDGSATKKLKSAKTNGKVSPKKKEKKGNPPGVRFVEMGGWDDTLDSIAESFQTIAKEQKKVTACLNYIAKMSHSTWESQVALEKVGWYSWWAIPYVSRVQSL